MGLDLELHPNVMGVRYNHPDIIGEGGYLGGTCLRLARDYVSFSKLGQGDDAKQAAFPRPCPPQVTMDRETDSGTVSSTTDDCYGAPLTYVTAGELAPILAKSRSVWNRAVGSLMAALPAETVVVLDWC